MTNLNTIQLNSNSGHHFKAVQFTSASKEHMLAINKHLGAQAFQEKYIDSILESYHDGDTFIPLFYKDGGSSYIDLYDWLYVRNGEVYATNSLHKLVDVIMEIREEIEND